MSSCWLAGCEDRTTTQLQPPVDWQAHLKLAELPENFVPAISETMYVPVYSHIYFEDNQRTVQLSSTLSIRNTDADNSIILKSIRYYDSTGKLVQNLLKEPVLLGPYATADVVVPRTHEAGGSGANFIVEWMAEKLLAEPLVEAVMVSTGATQSVSFTSRAVVTKRTESKAKEVR